MGKLIDFIKAKKDKRDIVSRKLNKNQSVVDIAKQYGKDYWDGDRKYGYGGYYYDGRWKRVAERLINHYNLKPGSKVLDVGCGKGFLVKDLLESDVAIDAFGVDLSQYAIENCVLEAREKLKECDAIELPFPDNFFDLVVSFNTLHNLDRNGVLKALIEIKRVGRGPAFIQVDSYETQQEKEIFQDWVLTAEFHDFPHGWQKLFDEVGYDGDYFWTIVK